ncbi:hypothetical protein DH2020_049754 [Rehmannia glutinosa]|uniref:RRM domain-containing protein n=1 Tax=Rehmannia glutinosa TaxID=99300 RepID=A0ABR0U2E9_REHGL
MDKNLLIGAWHREVADLSEGLSELGIDGQRQCLDCINRMSASGYTVEITNLSPNATKKDVYDFFAFCGAIQHVEIVRNGAGEYEYKAYVTFKNPHAVETAVLLNQHSQGQNVFPPAGKAVSLAQDVAKTVASKGYVLGKDALGKAKAFDESHHVAATAVAKVTELSQGIGLTNKISAGFEAAKSMDQRYHISRTTTSAVYVTRRTAVSAANTVVSSSYLSKGALWLSGALSRASQVAADLSSRGVSK